MKEWFKRNFRMYTDGDEWENTQDIVDLSMKVLFGIALLTWGAQL